MANCREKRIYDHELITNHDEEREKKEKVQIKYKKP